MYCIIFFLQLVFIKLKLKLMKFAILYISFAFIYLTGCSLNPSDSKIRKDVANNLNERFPGVYLLKEFKVVGEEQGKTYDEYTYVIRFEGLLEVEADKVNMDFGNNLKLNRNDTLEIKGTMIYRKTTEGWKIKELTYDKK